MLAVEIIYQTLKDAFNNRVGPHPLPEKFEIHDGTYVTYQKVSTEALTVMEGWTGYDYVRMQLMVVNEDIVQCERAAQQVRWLMQEQDKSEVACVGSMSDFDPETQLFYETIDFMMWQTACEV